MEFKNNPPEQFVRFSWEADDIAYPYTDVWEMSLEEWEALTPQEIQARQEKQYAKWREYMNNPGA